jgi:hypothetical protein
MLPIDIDVGWHQELVMCTVCLVEEAPHPPTH